MLIKKNIGRVVEVALKFVYSIGPFNALRRKR